MRGYFEHVYRNEDPYAIAEEPEEHKKRAASIAVLGGRRFSEALEIGGGEGLLAEQLAEHVDSLLMVDLSKRALERAAARLDGKANVRLGRLDVVAEPLPGSFDLIVCSEVLVYVQVGELDAVRDKIVGGLRPGGSLLLVHSRSIHDDESGLEYKDIGARTIHEPFLTDSRMRPEADETFQMYRITLLRKQDGEPT